MLVWSSLHFGSLCGRSKGHTDRRAQWRTAPSWPPFSWYTFPYQHGWASRYPRVPERRMNAELTSYPHLILHRCFLILHYLPLVSWSEALLTPEGSNDCHRKRRSHGIYHTRFPTLEMSVVSGSPFHGASLLLTKDGAACGAASFHKTGPLLGQSAQEWVRFSFNLRSTICSWIIRGW